MTTALQSDTISSLPKDLGNLNDSVAQLDRAFDYETGITERTLSLIMNGKRKCTLEEYVKLCRLAGCDFTYFMNDADEKSAKGA